jgi:LysR family transcriptional regulator, nitrogen assimilation regulatory protein
MSALDLRSLRTFIAVVDAGSLSKAAATLFVAQPALTAQIKKLEGELAAQLLERSHAGVTPTPVGLQLYQDGRRLLADAAAIKDRIQHSAVSPEGSATLAVPLLLVSMLVGPLLMRLKREYPRVRVYVLDDTSLLVRKAMTDGRADLALLVDTPTVHGLICQPLAQESIFLSGRDTDRRVPLSEVDGRRVVTFDVAAALPLVLQSPRYAIRQAVERIAAERGLSLNVVQEHDSTNVIRSLHMAGAGFTFTPASSVGDRPAAAPDWLHALVVEPGITRSYYLAHSATRTTTPAARVVSETLRALVQELIEIGRWQARLMP